MFLAAIVLTFIIPDSAAYKQEITISSAAILHLHYLKRKRSYLWLMKIVTLQTSVQFCCILSMYNQSDSEGFVLSEILQPQSPSLSTQL